MNQRRQVNWQIFLGPLIGLATLFLIQTTRAQTNYSGGEEKSVFEPSTKAKKLVGLSLEELAALQVDTVYGASKHEQKITEAPSAVTIISRDQIQKYGYRTLAEVLNSAPGLYVRNDRNFSLLGIRGFGHPGDYNTSFLVLVDGHRLNDAVTDRALIDNGFGLDVDLIERVEVIRGPGSSLYGDNAFFGVINVITRRGRDLGGAEAAASAGSLGSYTGRFSFGNQFSNGVELVISGTYQHSEGNPRLYFQEFNTPANNQGVADHQDSEQSQSLFAALSWKDFTTEFGYVERTKQIPTASYGTVFNDPRNQTKDSQVFADFKYEHEFGDALDLLARIGYDRGTTIGTYIYDQGQPALVANIDDYLSERLTGDLQLRRSFFSDHTVTAGAQWVENLDLNQRNYDTYPPVNYLDDQRSGTDYGLYLQDEYQILKELILNAGVRYDHFQSFGSTVNPRLALIYQPLEMTTVKFLYGTAFRAPSPNELYYSDGGISQVPSPNLKPETIATYEVILEQKLGRHWSASASGFYYRIRNLVGETTLPAGGPNAGAIQLQNLGSAKAKGLEFALLGSWTGYFEGRASYSLTDARDAISGDRLANSPTHLAKLNLSVPVYHEKVFASLELLYESDRKTLTGRNADGFGTANFTLYSRELVAGLDISASVYNLFDSRYREPGGPEHVQDLLQQDGRSFRLKLTYKF